MHDIEDGKLINGRDRNNDSSILVIAASVAAEVTHRRIIINIVWS